MGIKVHDINLKESLEVKIKYTVRDHLVMDMVGNP